MASILCPIVQHNYKKPFKKFLKKWNSLTWKHQMPKHIIIVTFWLVFLGSMVKALTFCAFWVWVSISWIIAIWRSYDLYDAQFVAVHAIKVFHSISPLVPSLIFLINVAWNYYFINTQHIKSCSPSYQFSTQNLIAYVESRFQTRGVKLWTSINLIQDNFNTHMSLTWDTKCFYL